MTYRVEIAKSAQKQMRGLPIQAQERIAENIGLLAHNPRNPMLDVKVLTNDRDARYRLRVGVYRIKFNQDDVVRIISIVKIAHRKDAYR